MNLSANSPSEFAGQGIGFGSHSWVVVRVQGVDKGRFGKGMICDPWTLAEPLHGVFGCSVTHGLVCQLPMDSIEALSNDGPCMEHVLDVLHDGPLFDDGDILHGASFQFPFELLECQAVHVDSSPEPLHDEDA